MCIYFVVNGKRLCSIYTQYTHGIILLSLSIILLSLDTLHASQVGANGRGHHARESSAGDRRSRIECVVKSGSAEAAACVKRHPHNACRVIYIVYAPISYTGWFSAIVLTHTPPHNRGCTNILIAIISKIDFYSKSLRADILILFL